MLKRSNEKYTDNICWMKHLLNEKYFIGMQVSWTENFMMFVIVNPWQWDLHVEDIS